MSDSDQSEESLYSDSDKDLGNASDVSILSEESQIEDDSGDEVAISSPQYWFTQISNLVIFNRYLTDTNQYILGTNIISKIGKVSVKYQFIPFSTLVRFSLQNSGAK